MTARHTTSRRVAEVEMMRGRGVSRSKLCSTRTAAAHTEPGIKTQSLHITGTKPMLFLAAHTKLVHLSDTARRTEPCRLLWASYFDDSTQYRALF